MKRFFAPLGLLVILGCMAHAAELRTETQYLSGHGSDDATLWGFYCTAGRNSGIWTKIAVPSCWEQQGFGTYEYGVEVRPSKRIPNMPVADEKGVYRREFNVPADWRGRVVRIVFDGVMTDAEVKINGMPAGPIHQGAFYRFKYDITDKLRFDAPNVLEVTVAKYSANASVNHAERQGDYWNFGGMFRPVWLEALPQQFIDRVAIDARADGSFAADVFLGGELPAGNEVVVQIRTVTGEPVGELAQAAVPAGSKKVTLHTHVANVATWTAETPTLYRADITLRAGAVAPASHSVTQRFGFRTVEVRAGDGVYVNGHKITMKGVDRHSFWPETGRTLSLVRQREDVELMKEANINAVRMSHYPPDAAFLDLCDEAGLYVLDELGGWHGHYDTPTGRKLIAEMVTRDVNHPSILIWDNGNEGGENPENDDEFAKYDPQQRHVIHPWANFRGLNTRHYRDYAETAKLAEGPDIFMPTEFLHGLYDGGGGAGLEDYWAIMGEKPRAAGGFIWVWADEAVARADEGGRLDAKRDLAPDGIVGPHHEKEGSYFAVRDIWCPVQIPVRNLPADFNGTLPVRNRYDFLNLSGTTFEWRLLQHGAPGALLFHRKLLALGRVPGPDVAPRADGELKLPLPADWRDADVLEITAIDAHKRELWTWTWQWKSGVASIGRATEAIDPRDPQYASALKRTTPTTASVAQQDLGGELVVSVGRVAARFNKSTGLLAGLERDGQRIALADGPRLVAYRCIERGFEPVAAPASKLLKLESTREGDAVVIAAKYEGALHDVRWKITPDGDVHLEYAFHAPGSVDLLGIDFGYPEEKMKSKSWVGGGPYRVWRNRMRGTQLDWWDTDYNDPKPGESWTYPEFKGWFSDWRWMAFTTTEGKFAFLNDSGQPFVGVYSPRDGDNNPVLVLPRTGLGVYQVIPAIGSKTARPDHTGPQGQPQNVTGDAHGSLVIRVLEPR